MALSAVATPCPTVSSAAQSTLVLGGMSALAMWQHQTTNLGVRSSNLLGRANNVTGGTELFLAGAFTGWAAAAR
jgi:hypothetical protein